MLLVFDVADHGDAFEFGEKIRNPVRASFGDGQEQSRHVNRFVDNRVARSMEPMVVLWAQMENEKPAAKAGLGVLHGNTDEIGQRILVAFHLHHHSAHDFAAAQQLAICRRNEKRRGMRRPGVGDKTPREKFLKGVVLVDGLFDLADVDPVNADHHLNHLVVDEPGDVG